MKKLKKTPKHFFNLEAKEVPPGLVCLVIAHGNLDILLRKTGASLKKMIANFALMQCTKYEKLQMLNKCLSSIRKLNFAFLQAKKVF
jgi:hypothetical protein